MSGFRIKKIPREIHCERGLPVPRGSEGMEGKKQYLSEETLKLIVLVNQRVLKLHYILSSLRLLLHRHNVLAETGATN